ncbi:MAG: hypothetical protein IJ154_04765 [Bacteroidales bacterium]|nr:hypothetical protein [Bacteroidales bacterium]
MKTKVLFLLAYLFLLPAYTFAERKESETIKMELRMYKCLEKSLKQNYGSADTYTKLIKDLEDYDNLFILNVDRKAVKRISKKLFSSGLVYYFFDKREIESMRVKHRFLSPRVYAPFSTDRDGFMYKEMASCNNAVAQKIVVSHEVVGATSPAVINGILQLQEDNTAEKNKIMERFLGVYFWPYLCYCANIDFSTGEPK